jgi:1,2-diacylglycerol 3-alpha-glucosyltransferase
MKIAIFTDAFYPYISGVVTAVEIMAKGLADRGHQVLIVAPKYDTACTFEYPNVKLLTCTSFSGARLYDDLRFAFPINPRILKKVIQEKIDVIHFTAPATLGMQAVSIAKLLKIPLVGTFHTFIADPEYLGYAKMG